MKLDYNALIHHARIPADEPTFLLRAQDLAAAETVRRWVRIAYREGVDHALVELALQQADAMDAWPVKKLPDADHLQTHERLQLAYHLSRRAWTAALGSHLPDPQYEDALLLAEARGHAAGVSSQRPTLRKLEQIAIGADLKTKSLQARLDASEARVEHLERLYVNLGTKA